MWLFAIVCTHMYSKVTLNRAAFPTNLTLVGFLPGVRTLMADELRVPCEALFAKRAFVWLNAGVHAHMLSEIPRLSERFIAFRTLKSFNVSVISLRVMMQMRRRYKTLATDVTLIWLLSCVNARMNAELTRSYKCLIANLALKTFITIVYSHVRCQGTTVRKTHTTKIAKIRLFSCVRPPVILQVPRSCKDSGTELALMDLRRLFTSMYTHVFRKMTFLREVSLAHLALKWLLPCVRTHVYLKKARGREASFTNLALTCFI